MALLDMMQMQKNESADAKISQNFSLTKIAERQGISVSYLEQLFLQLKRSGILRSIKGPGGGYAFAKDPDKIMLYDVLSAVGEKIGMIKCSAGPESCNNMSGKCIAHKLWAHLDDHVSGYFSSISLDDIINGKFANTKTHKYDQVTQE